jgi:hypothetical protein
VNYFTFCQDVDKPEDMFPGYISKRPVPDPAALTGEENKTSTGKNFFAGSTRDINVL